MSIDPKQVFDAKQAPHAIFPLGGIGAGSIAIGADGRFQDWEIFNRPSKGSVNGFTHFAVRAEKDGDVLDTRVLHGPFMGDRTGSHLAPMYSAYGFGAHRQNLTGLPSFRSSSLRGPYPVAELVFEDQDFPAKVVVNATSPFIPLNDRDSSMPVAMFDVKFENLTDDEIEFTLFACIGFDFVETGSPTNVTINTSNGTQVVGQTKAGRDDLNHRQICVATDHKNTSFQHNLYRGNWFDTMEVYWHDISAPGPLKDRHYSEPKDLSAQNQSDAIEHAVLACHLNAKAREAKNLHLALSWYVPNVNRYWESNADLACCGSKGPEDTWQNWYATEWNSAAEIAQETISRWCALTSETVQFQSTLIETTLPAAVTEAISANISILKSATVLRLEDGTFYGWEGCHANEGCCEGSCTHVWNYQQALPFLFPALERSMRVADFVENQDPDTGGMAFRMMLPKGVGRSATRPCVDGQFGNVMKAYRDWKLFGDKAWLEQIWPNIRAAIAFAWHPDNEDRWDPDKTGYLSGRQHHTLDMELFGPSSWLAGFYLGALLAGAELAEVVGDNDTAVEYRALFEMGYARVDQELFNGRWFAQDIDISDRELLTPFQSEKGQLAHIQGDVFDQYWSDEHGELKYQLGAGCAIDQVLAEWHARIYGLPHIYDDAKFRSSVLAIWEHNYVARLGDLANPCRVFGMEEESGTMIAAWPEDVCRPVIPLPYAQETMHGFEYAFGCQLMIIGEIDKAVRVFEAVRERYRGNNRNPWNEIECGSHYARSMSCFAAIPILSGFSFDAGAGTIGFAPTHRDQGKFQAFWSNGQAWGQITMNEDSTQLCVLGGALSISALHIDNRAISAADLAAVAEVSQSGSRVTLPVGTVLNL